MEKKDNQDTGNLRLWRSWQHVAPGMLKEIKGGNLNGKSDINPLWRFQALTDAFGPCGIGWTVTEVERWTNECAGEVGAFVKVALRINVGGTWSEPIEGTGGSKLCGKGRGDGLNDEAWKMATTDAISVACKSLGMGADVYCGLQSHKDEDQKKSGGDYGSKYEERNYRQNSPRNSRTGNYTPNGQYGQNSAPQAANPGEYVPPQNLAGTGAPAPQYQAGPVTVPESGRVHIVLATVTTGRCKSIIEKQSARDYDDLPDWQAGIQAIRDRYDVDPDAMAEIEKRAVELRDAKQQAAISNLQN